MSKEFLPAISSSSNASVKGKSKAKVSQIPSSNWLALQKKIKTSDSQGRKRRKIEHNEPESSSSTKEVNAPFVRGKHADTDASAVLRTKNGESIDALRRMVTGKMEYTPNQKLQGKFLSLDCEMVGVGIDGSESSLARVSIVNFHGYVLLDEFVRQRERVVDYRTQWSGIRPADMMKAKPFEEVQKQVAELLAERVLVGHAVFNDLKALLLSHPYPLTRDTQMLAGKHKLSSSRRPALRVLAKQELDISIQEGEHSSVTDARATMAIYRLHRKEWDVSLPRVQSSKKHAVMSEVDGKRKRARGDDEDEDEEQKEQHDEDGSEKDEDDVMTSPPKSISQKPRTTSPKLPSITSKSKLKIKTTSAVPGGGRKGVSSGLSTIVTSRGTPAPRLGASAGAAVVKMAGASSWWKELPGSGSVDGGGGSKGSMSVRVRR